MAAKEINWGKVRIGTYFSCKIKGEETFGRIQKEDGSIYLCQDYVSGNNPYNTLGYDYGWCLSSGDNERIKANRITNLKLSTKRFKGMPKPPKMDVSLQISSTYGAKIFHDKIIVENENVSYLKLKEIREELNKHIISHTELKTKLNSRQYPDIKWGEITDGTWFISYINSMVVYGQIKKDCHLIYLCQNKFNGSKLYDKLGYEFAWYIGNGSQNRLEASAVKQLTILDEQPIFLNQLEVKELDYLCGYSSSYYNGKVNVGCQSFGLKMVDRVIAKMDKLRELQTEKK